MSQRQPIEPTNQKSTRWGRLPQAQQEAGNTGVRTIWRWASTGVIRVSRVRRITLSDLDSIHELIEKSATGAKP